MQKTGEEWSLREEQLVWLVEDSDKRRLYKLARVEHLTRGRVAIARYATAQTNESKTGGAMMEPSLNPKNTYDVASQLKKK